MREQKQIKKENFENIAFPLANLNTTELFESVLQKWRQKLPRF